MKHKEDALKSRIQVLGVLALAVVLAGVAATAWGQAGATGAVTGVVTDPTGGAVGAVKIVATEKSTGVKRDTLTDEAGRYRLVALPVGEYNVIYEANGFRQLVRQGVQVEAAVVRTIDVQLQVGELSQQVTVTEAVPLLSTSQATTFRQLNSLELVQVPSSTRNFTHLLSAEAGVNTDLPPVLGNDTGSLSPSVNGTRTTSNSLQFNGIDTTSLLTNEGSLTENIAPAPETIQEVKLQTSLYDAATGRNGGGNFQIITRGGSNEIHGSAYWFLQNEAFNANDFFFNLDGIGKPPARRHEGGFTLGGPAVKDKWFLFGSYQHTRALTAFVPTASSTVDLPQGLDFINGAVTAQSLLDGFNAARVACGQAPLNVSGNPLTASDVSSIAVALFGATNPVTGRGIIPASGRALDCSGGVAGAGQRFDPNGNPVVRVRNVQPSEFFQNQFTIRSDHVLSNANRFNAVFFFSNFPSLDSFPDPSSLASPFTLRRNNRARTLALTDTHVFSPTVVNEARFGFLFLNNTRRLDDAFLADSLTSAAFGLDNPALDFDDSPGTRRLGHFVWRNIRHSFGGPNDSFNRREQMSLNFSDTLSWTRGAHSLRFGVEYRRHFVDNDLPEEQATEFEKFNDFTQFLRGLATEADTQYGITAKQFRMTDLAWFVAHDWKFSNRLTVNLGLRWDWFGWPVEKNGLVGNFDPDLADTENPINGIFIPSNAQMTGLAPIDSAIAAVNRASTNHTLHGQDLNNFQPRVGFAWQPFASNRFVLRGGYGMFFDRPSAAFINTLFSNFPHLREIEVTFPSGAVPLGMAFSQQDTTLPLNAWFPFRATFENFGSTSGNYRVRDNTGVTLGADGATPNPPCEAAGVPCAGNVAETLEFRAIDRNLKTPYIQQWNLGFQYEIARDMMWEVRYAGTKGTRLLNALALAQSFDLNDPNTPDYVFARLNDAYIRGGAPRGALGAGSIPAGVPANACPGNQPSCLAGVGRAFGFMWPNDPNPTTGFGALAGTFDLNLGRPVPNRTTAVIIPFEVRAAYLGMNVPEAIILKSTGNSIYHALQTNFTKRYSSGLQFNLGYTLSRSIDDASADPGSTAGGGKPDVPNIGFIVQGDSRNTRANRGLSDFDRTHRFSLSFVYDIPTGGSNSIWLKGWQLSGFAQAQSGAPYSIFAAEPEGTTAAALLNRTSGSGGLFRLGFGRPNITSGATISDLTNTGDRLTAFNTSVLESPLGSFGNLGRNILRGDGQKRFDMALTKSTALTERWKVEFRWEVFNVFNNVNFALPVNDLQDSSVGAIENTVGGPRVMQFGLRIAF